MNLQQFEFIAKLKDNVIHARNRESGVDVVITRYELTSNLSFLKQRLNALHAAQQQGAIHMLDGFVGNDGSASTERYHR